jgi:hypothetical protein
VYNTRTHSLNAGDRLLHVLGESACIRANAINGERVIRIAQVLSMSTILVKALILFKIFNHNDDENVTVQGIEEFYAKYLEEIKFPHDESRSKDLIGAFLKKFQLTGADDRLDFDRFYSILNETPTLLDSLQLMNLPNNDEQVKKLERMAWFKNNLPQIVFIVIYILANIGMSINVIVTHVVHEGNGNGWFVVAHISGSLTKINFALSIILMLRQCMALVRQQHWLRRLCPVDDHIDAHRYVGYVLAVSLVVHSLAHIINYATHTAGK